MRTLKFIVDEMHLKPDPNCDFSGLVPGTAGYLLAEFSFSPEWNGFVKVVEFTSPMGREYPPKQLTNDNLCVIPEEALTKRKFNIRVLGKNGDLKLTTTYMTVCQNGGKK